MSDDDELMMCDTKLSPEYQRLKSTHSTHSLPVFFYGEHSSNNEVAEFKQF